MNLNKLIIPNPNYLVAERFAKDPNFDSKHKMELWLISAREKDYFSKEKEEQIRQICNKTNNKRKWYALFKAYDAATNTNQDNTSNPITNKKHITAFYINLAEEFASKPLQKSITDFIWAAYKSQ